MFFLFIAEFKSNATSGLNNNWFVTNMGGSWLCLFLSLLFSFDPCDDPGQTIRFLEVLPKPLRLRKKMCLRTSLQTREVRKNML